MRLLNFLSNQPWAITPEYAQKLLEIADGIIERKAQGERLDKEALERQLGRPLDNTRTVTVRPDNYSIANPGVATIPVEGPLFRRADMFLEISGATTIDALAKDFNAALDDPAIKAIILKIDSPGGEVNGTNEFSDMIFAARDRKPIVAYIEGSGNSAAYWIASAAEEIVLDATSDVGSIGVVVTVNDPNKRNSRTLTFVSPQSPNKRPDPTTESGKAQITALAADIAQVFVDTVARNRNVSSETVVKDFGAGGLLIGQKAVDAGLADRVGSYESVLSELTSGDRKPRNNGENKMSAAVTTTKPEANSRWEKFMAWMDGESTASAPAVIKATEDSDEVKQLRAKAAQAEKYESQIKEARKKEAEAFASELITSKRLLPAGKEKVESAFIQAAEDDAAHPLTSGSRVEKFKSSFDGLPKHSLTTEKVAAEMPSGAVALNPDAGSEEDKIIAETRKAAADWQKTQQARLQEVK